jgi:serine phosphatase RsbU (regulator of sigma subunit)
MNLRVRLIVAFFLLSVVPLTAVTYVSYTSNARALRDAAEHEADLLAGELGQRMQLVTSQLGERVEHLMNVAQLQAEIGAAEQRVSQAAAPPAVTETDAMDQQVADALGAAAMLLNNVELRGLRVRGRGGRLLPRPGDSNAPPPPGAPRQPPRPSGSRGRPTPPGATSAGRDQPPAEGEADRLRIDLAPIRREVLQQLLPDRQMDSLSSDERARLGRELNARMLGIAEGIQLGAAELQKRAEGARQAQAAATAPASNPVPVVRTRSALQGTRLGVTVERDGEVVQELDAEINLPNILATVFSTTRSDRGEVPFSVDTTGQIYTRSAEDRGIVLSLGPVATVNGPASARVGNWIVVTTTDPAGAGLRLGIARPVGDSLAELRRAALVNLGLGLGFIALALAGIVPLSTRLTRNLSALGEGVHRIAAGDYRVRVPVRSRDEVGRLAGAFNQMAADVERHQQLAVGQERLKRELELGRQIQNDMLPHAPLRLGLTEIRGVSVPAREVGGDFFNYFELPGGELALLVGDVSGKGVGAALLMANIQASLRTRLALGQDLSAVTDAIDREIEAGSPGPLYATLFVAILNPVTRVLRYVNAGHHPQFVLRRAGGLDAMPSCGLPVGMIAGRGYIEQRVQLAPGDVLFFYTDGCVEAENGEDDMFGAERLEALLAEGATGMDDVLARVEAAVAGFRGGREAGDDATMMAVNVG